MNHSARILIAMLTMWSVAVLTAPTLASERSALETAHALVKAFNEHDAAKMASLVTDDFELYYFDNEGKAGLGTTGPAQLEKEMTGYFKARPDVKSTVAAEIAGERFVSFREQIVGGKSSLAVYEIHEGKVKRAWYYPAE